MKKIHFAEIASQSENQEVRQYYVNFKRLIDFVREKNFYEKNLEFYNQKIQEINEILEKNFHEKYDKEAKKKIVKNFQEILHFIEQNEKFYPKSYFMVIYMSLGMSFGMMIGMFFHLHDPSISFVIWVPFGMLIGMIVGMYIDKQNEKNGKIIPVNIEDRNENETK